MSSVVSLPRPEPDSPVAFFKIDWLNGEIGDPRRVDLSAETKPRSRTAVAGLAVPAAAFLPEVWREFRAAIQPLVDAGSVPPDRETVGRIREAIAALPWPEDVRLCCPSEALSERLQFLNVDRDPIESGSAGVSLTIRMGRVDRVTVDAFTSSSDIEIISQRLSSRLPDRTFLSQSLTGCWNNEAFSVTTIPNGAA